MHTLYIQFEADKEVWEDVLSYIHRKSNVIGETYVWNRPVSLEEMQGQIDQVSVPMREFTEEEWKDLENGGKSIDYREIIEKLNNK